MCDGGGDTGSPRRAATGTPWWPRRCSKGLCLPNTTCFLCEIYCPTDALYVAPGAEGPTAVSEAEIVSAGLFGPRWAGAAASPAAPTFRLRAAAR